MKDSLAELLPIFRDVLSAAQRDAGTAEKMVPSFNLTANAGYAEEAGLSTVRLLPPRRRSRPKPQ